MDSETLSLRFGGIARLYGIAGLERLQAAHACVVGVGGVGGWAVEALARTGVGRLTLVDMDEVCESNINRQVHALDGNVGRAKVDVLAERIAAINPDCEVTCEQRFYTQTSADTLLSEPFHAVLDAIDNTSLKAHLLAECRGRGLPVVTMGGAGGRRDPTAVRVADLAHTFGDGLLQGVRKKLRTEHGFPRREKQVFGVPCVFSTEEPVYPSADGGVCATRDTSQELRLDCASGYGTATFVVGAFGFTAAAEMVKLILPDSR